MNLFRKNFFYEWNFENGRSCKLVVDRKNTLITRQSVDVERMMRNCGLKKNGVFTVNL